MFEGRTVNKNTFKNVKAIGIPDSWREAVYTSIKKQRGNITSILKRKLPIGAALIYDEIHSISEVLQLILDDLYETGDLCLDSNGQYYFYEPKPLPSKEVILNNINGSSFFQSLAVDTTSSFKDILINNALQTAFDSLDENEDECFYDNDVYRDDITKKLKSILCSIESELTVSESEIVFKLTPKNKKFMKLMYDKYVEMELSDGEQ